MYHVMTKQGDARAEVDAALKALEGRGIGREGSGFHKYMHVTRAEQTVVMLERRDSPLATELRGARGWTEPGDEPVQ